MMKYCYVIFQSVLKNIPVVGSLFGWFVSSPTSGSKGKTLSLQSSKFLNQVHCASFLEVILWYAVFLSIQLFNFCMYIHNIKGHLVHHNMAVYSMCCSCNWGEPE